MVPDLLRERRSAAHNNDDYTHFRPGAASAALAGAWSASRVIASNLMMV
jgi:hypothetical protein